MTPQNEFESFPLHQKRIGEAIFFGAEVSNQSLELTALAGARAAAQL
jgi:hypothetical protein